MRSQEHSLQYLRLDQRLQNDPTLLYQLFDDPQRVFDQVGVDEQALSCPDGAQPVLSRAELVAQQANSLGHSTLNETLPRLGAIMKQGLGADFTATKIPFGIRFAERVPEIFDDYLSGTASVACTFNFKCHGDVDG